VTTFRWLSGEVERVEVYRIVDGRAYVSWPDSGRIVRDLGWCVRPAGWVDAQRLTWTDQPLTVGDGERK
jgi:hypothetical protein